MASGSIAGVTVQIVDGVLPRRGTHRAIFTRPALDGYGDQDLGKHTRPRTLHCVHWTTSPDSFLDSLMNKQGERPVTVTTSRGESSGQLHIVAVRPGVAERVEKDGGLTYMVTAEVTVTKLAE